MARSRIEGLDRLNRKLARMPAEAKREIRAELDAGADRIVTLAKSLAPRETGFLQSTIRKADGDHELQVRVWAGGGDAFYAVFKEHGTENLPAHPFLFPSFRALKGSVQGRINRAVRRAAKRAAT